ncbi:Conserved_hypothetical protein [Hexamita inflata]|uniref:NAC-A/B domain-containing protein n=1 Tax=Hexamita inflata TaxID=28002 RepID=A0AA86PFD2_9EUKA|nr:Conserved hypothetical protein [Hexamita inflata]
MPGDLSKKLKNLKQRETRASNVPKSILSEGEQQAVFRTLNVQPMPHIEKVQIFQGETCMEFNRAQFAGSQTNNVWAIKGQHKTVESASTASEINQKKSIEELMKLVQQQSKKETPEVADAPVEKTD